MTKKHGIVSMSVLRLFPCISIKIMDRKPAFREFYCLNLVPFDEILNWIQRLSSSNFKYNEGCNDNNFSELNIKQNIHLIVWLIINLAESLNAQPSCWGEEGGKVSLLYTHLSLVHIAQQGLKVFTGYILNQIIS